MKNRQYKELHDELLSDIQVSDSTLDQARAELLKEGKSEKVKFKPMLKVLVPSLALVLCCLIIIPVIWHTVPNANHGSKGTEYHINDLEKREILSFAWYNEESASEIFYADLPANSWLYADGEKNVMLQETFSYQNIGCELSVILNPNDKIEEFQIFDELSLTGSCKSIEYFYGSVDGSSLATFDYGNEQYFLSVQGTDQTLFFEIIQLIIR